MLSRLNLEKCSTRFLPIKKSTTKAGARWDRATREETLLTVYTLPLSFAKIILSFVPKEGIRSDAYGPKGAFIDTGPPVDEPYMVEGLAWMIRWRHDKAG
jgi:hypothetical protein